MSGIRVTGTDCTCSCNSNYYGITTAMQTYKTLGANDNDDTTQLKDDNINA